MANGCSPILAKYDISDKNFECVAKMKNGVVEKRSFIHVTQRKVRDYFN